MAQSSPISQCPTYVPATQITPDPVDEIPTQQPDFLTQEDQRLLFQDDKPDGSSINAKDSLPKEGKHSGRDYYEQLFSSDSDTEDARSSTTLKNDVYLQESSSDMSISDSDLSEDDSIFRYQFKPLAIPHNNKPPSPIPKTKVNLLNNLIDLPDEEKNILLGYKQPIPKIIVQEKSPSQHIDKIASYNIQNKYDHISAAELMIKENLTFIAFQEPYIASNAPTDAWESFMKCELQSSRIDCFQTHHQIILIDTFRWGGKTVSNFQSFLNGRVTCVAFRFGDGKSLGIISVYASSIEVHDNITSGTNDDISDRISKIKSSWSKEFQNISTIIVGDLQETCTISNRDNIGKFRKSKMNRGILSRLEEDHESFVRKCQCKEAYVTRFGITGARGIDHIMIPSCEETQKLFPNAYICRNQGATFFPSDHSLIVCEYRRNDQNNNEDGISTIKYNYSKVCKIKMKNTGLKGKNISLDTSQFKDCKNFRDQSMLYNNIQKLSGDDADITDYHISPLEQRIDALIHDIWTTGKEQGVCGSKNKLVKITEGQAMELAFTFKQFMNGINDTMHSLKLTEEKDNLASAGNTRGRLRQGKGFRMFQNLPIPSKVRYLRCAVKAKANLIQKAQNWLKELQIRQDGDSCQNVNEEDFWKIRDCIVKTNVIERHAKNIHSKLCAEEIERENHINAVVHMKSNKCNQESQMDGYENKAEEQPKSNFLPYVSASLSSLINSWLDDSDCKHGFNTLTLSKWLDVLIHDINAWKEPLTNFWEHESLSHNIEFRHRVQESLEECSIKLQKIQNRLSLLQIQYRKNSLLYFLRVNTIDAFTRKVLQKERSAPMTHTVIWDEKLLKMRPCVNEVEELHATQRHHGRWMGNTEAKENCAFAEIVIDGKLGPRGVKLKSERKLTMKDIPNLIHNGQKLSRKVKRAFIAAHNKYLHRLFRYPPKNRKEFFYPFYLMNKNGEMHNEKEIEIKLWKSLASIPSKARHAGFHMATIGRFGKRWRQLLWKMIKMMLVMRYIPCEMKKIARYPIPKPGKQNEYRPISLCNDIYCFLNGIITNITSKAIEKAKILHSGIASYRRGKSCATLVAVEQSFREDCIEGNVPCVQLDEDEEKFFDRVCLEIILTAMRVNGFPDSGFIEFKACMMGEKLVEIVTCKGTAFAKFVCGLEQGNPDSPTIANLVIKLKHDAWSSISERIRDIIKNDPKSKCYDRYRFHVYDRDDGEIWIHMMGYCDDNTKFLSADDENLLLPLVQRYVQLAGDLSMITKIGRKSSKCEIHFYNISANLAIKLEKSWSTAWSFVHDAPIEEQVPFKIFLQDKELKSFYKLVKYENITSEEQNKWNQIVHPKAHRHLGLTATLGADTSESSQATINKMYDRLSKLKINNMEHGAQVKCSNMLVTSMHSYVPLQNNFDQEELQRIDSTITNATMKRNGLSHSDCKHRIFLSEKMGGLGFLSTLEVDIVSTARELEILSNCQGIDSETFRTRIAAMEHYKNPNDKYIRNHARAAIHKLARYGIFFRDNRDGVVNDIIHDIAKKNNVFTIGNDLYKDGNGFTMGSGKSKYVNYAFGSKLHLALQQLQQKNWTTGEKSDLDQNLIAPYTTADVLKLRQSLGKKRFSEVTAFHSYYEWHNFHSTALQNNLNEEKQYWKKVNIGEILIEKYPCIQPWEWVDRNILINEITAISRIRWDMQLVSHPESVNNTVFNTHSIYGKVMNFLDIRGSPLIIASDGAHALRKEDTKTASSFAICCLDIRSNETLDSAEWIHRPMIPILARTCQLPHYIGSTQADIAHGEGMAFLMQEMCFEEKFPRIIISDSKAIREQFLNIRKDNINEIDRNFVRKAAGGISKYLVSIVRNHINTKMNCKPVTPNNEQDGASYIRAKFQQRTDQFLKIAKSWVTEDNDLDEEAFTSKEWDQHYFDDHRTRPILKVDSHQLDKFGRKMKSSPRYTSLVPNIALLNANHHADIGAEIGVKLASFFDSNDVSNASTKFRTPSSGLTFCFMCEGETVDRHINEDINRRLQIERVKRLKTKQTQGFLWRIFPYVTIKWETLNLHKGFFRSLLGMSNSHSRCIYKSTTYRAGALQQHLQTVNDAETRKSIEESSIKDQNRYILKCAWCTTSNSSMHKGNRRHVILHCSNPKIYKFRRRMLNLLGLQISIFFEELEKITSTNATISFINEIEKVFLKLQNDQMGCLKKLSKARNILYVDIQSCLTKLQKKSITAAMKSNAIEFFLNLFHLQPERMANEPTDEELGVLDAVWMGLMPKNVAKLIQKHIKICSMKLDLDDRSSWRTQMEHSWKAIETLNMGRIIGIHRIMTGVGSDLKQEFISEFDLQDLENEIRKRKRKRQNAKEGKSETKCNNAKRQKKLREDSDSVNTRCNGITCGLEKIRWCSQSKFQPNMIRVNRKQCLRCSLFTTAMKTTVNMLIDLQSSSESQQFNLIQTLRKMGIQKKIKYSSLMNMLQKCIPKNKQFERAQYISKHRPTEKWKKICKLLIELAKRDTKTITKENSTKQYIQTWITDMEQTLQVKNNELKTDTLFLRKCMEQFRAEIDPSKIKSKPDLPNSELKKASKVSKHKCQECNHLPFAEELAKMSNSSVIIIDNSPNINNEEEEPAPPVHHQTQEEMEELLRVKLSMMNRRLYTAGKAILMAIEVLRWRHKDQNIFIACPEAAQIIEKWNPNEGWARFARIFYSINVCHRKPNGLYLIPIFSGDNEAGHWKVAAVEKSGGQRKAALLDSLGTGQLEDPVIRLITQAFSPNRGSISWIAPSSRQQTGVECGARTICALAVLAKEFRDGKTLQEGTHSASLMDAAEYDQMEVRRTAANLLGEYRRCMISRAIRLRR